MGNSTVFGTVDICSIQIGSVKSTYKGSIAQLVEQLTFNQPVIGSIPIALSALEVNLEGHNYGEVDLVANWTGLCPLWVRLPFLPLIP